MSTETVLTDNSHSVILLSHLLTKLEGSHCDFIEHACKMSEKQLIARDEIL